jgi:hypothetical protein
MMIGLRTKPTGMNMLPLAISNGRAGEGLPWLSPGQTFWLLVAIAIGTAILLTIFDKWDDLP